VREATVAELASVPKVTPKMAQKIYDHFHPDDQGSAPAEDRAAGAPPGVSGERDGASGTTSGS